MHRLICAGAALILSVAATAAMAQQRGGTPEQRAACGADVRKLCSNVNPKDPAAIPRCLGMNRAKLSNACRKALKL